jgi:D-3-phosphoglycerate dehydrogenase / 2-oxoglutarate reductase
MRPAVFLSFAPASRALYYGDDALNALREIGDVRLNERSEPLDTDALLHAARDCQVIVSDRLAAAPAPLFAASPQLAVFMRCAVDIRNIDVAAASAAGVLVTHASAGFANAVAEWVLGAMLDLGRGLSDSVTAYRAGGKPEPRVGRELHGATLGVIGYGHIGRRVGEIGRCLGMQVLACDPVRHADAPDVRWCALEGLLAEADHVVCLAPARPETEKMMNAARFARMKPGAFFINASRGELVDEQALLQALDNGQLGGAALDVGRAPDQMPTPALARHARVIATPHIGGLTPPAVAHQALETVAQLRELLRGGLPAGAVNPVFSTRLAALRGAD